MGRVVVVEEGHAKGVEWQINGLHGQPAKRCILIDRLNVVFSADFKPSRFKHEPKIRIVSVAFRVYFVAFEFPLYVGDLIHQLIDKGLEVVA